MKTGPGWATKHKDFEATIHTHFTSTMKKGPRRTWDFNWDNMQQQDCNLSCLTEDFSEKEVHEAIKALLPDKAPSMDGFTGIFFKSCWSIIKEDLIKVITLFSNIH
jgi:hypothetical protein